MISRLLFSLATASLVSGAALAADLPMSEPPMEPMAVPATAHNWTGVYVGIQGGRGFATGNHTDTAGTSSGNYDIDGWLAGGTVGGQWQWNQIVLGIEGDIAWTNMEGSTAGICAPTCESDFDAFATLRGRAGFAFDRFMPYITGGVAFADLNVSQGAFGSSDWITGWTAGGGLEFAATQHLSLKAEALYVDLEDLRYTVAIPVDVSTEDMVVVRGGVNWKF